MVYGLSVYIMTFDLGWHWKVKSRSFGVHWAVYHTQCIIRQRSCQAERPLVYEFFKYWKKSNYIFFFQYFKFSPRFMLFPTLKKNWYYKLKKPGGGGCGFFYFSFHVTVFDVITAHALISAPPPQYEKSKKKKKFFAKFNPNPNPMVRFLAPLGSLDPRS